MKDIGQQLCSTRLTDGEHSALTMSPRQPSTNRDPRPEAPTLLYQGSEAEASLLTLATCFKCKSVHEVPIQDLKTGSGSGQEPREDRYVCFRCNFAVAPHPFPFPNSNPSTPQVLQSTADVPPSPTIATAPGNKFKVRNFKPGKYYCDKCRFSTKDPLQYKKHTTQHEEIKFICSHCSYVSYTKGEFQRHLVKHTGVFPYRCEYCDYGAIRNDYIVKHRRRVHERAGGAAKRPPKTPARPEPKRTTVPLKPRGPEPFRALSEQLARFSGQATKTRMPNPPSSSRERQKDVVCVPNRSTKGASRFEDKSVEVEVLSPAREPLQPGMPLTVVAPSELVVPANCLAQLVDVKVVNGTQQLVLRFFPLDENGSPESAAAEGADAGDPGCMDGDKGLCRPDPRVCGEQTRSPGAQGPGEGQVQKLGGFHSLQPLIQKQLRDVRWVRSYDFFMSKGGMRGSPREWLLPSERGKEDWQDRGTRHPHQAPFPSLSLKRPLSPTSLVRNGVLRGLAAASGPIPPRAATTLAEAGVARSPPGSSEVLFPLPVAPAALTFPADTGLMALGRSGLNPRGHISFPVNMVPSSRRLSDSQAEEPRTALQSGSPCAPSQGEYLQLGIPRGEDPARPQRPGARPLELTASQRPRDAMEGPVISSVFSLSSGSTDVPRDVQWSGSGSGSGSSSSSRIKSLELLRRKIAKLIESCGRPPSLASSTVQRHPPEKGRPPAAPRNGQEISVSFPKAQGAGDIPPGRLYPQFLEGGSGKSEGRATRKSHITTPVLIPKGAVLRVLNSSEDTGIIEATCDTPVTIPCREAGLIDKPLPFCPATPTNSDAQTSFTGGPVDASPNPDTPPPLRLKPRREGGPCSVAPKKASPLHAQPGSSGSTSELSKPGRPPPSRSLPTSKNKAKQVGTPKKKGRTPPAEPSRCLKDPSIFQVARQLRLMAVKPNQLIRCPRRNQPVIVLNHPDVDSPEVSNVMKVINKYKGNVLKVVLSERTRYQLGIRRHHVRLTYRNAEASHLRRQLMLKMKLKKVHRNNYQVVDALPEDSAAQCIFKCWFCGRLYEDQEEWMSHGQRHLIEATRDWELLSSKAK